VHFGGMCALRSAVITLAVLSTLLPARLAAYQAWNFQYGHRQLVTANMV
jgi:hypothetical protein